MRREVRLPPRRQGLGLAVPPPPGLAQRSPPEAAVAGGDLALRRAASPSLRQKPLDRLRGGRRKSRPALLPVARPPRSAPHSSGQDPVALAPGGNPPRTR